MFDTRACYIDLMLMINTKCLFIASYCSFLYIGFEEERSVSPYVLLQNGTNSNIVNAIISKVHFNKHYIQVIE